MNVPFLAQAPLFAAGTACIVILLRTLPRLRVHGRPASPSLIACAVPGVVAAPALIAILGHVSPQAYSDPTSYPVPQIVFSTTVTLLLTFSVAAFWIAFRSDPARGRRRCAKCWYDMRGATGSICPECGHTAKSERDLLRTRRSRFVPILAAVSLMMSYGVLKAPQVRDQGWFALVPNTAVIAALPHLPSKVLYQMRWSAHERFSEFSQEHVWPWQRSLLRWRLRRVFDHSTNLAAIARVSYLIEIAFKPWTEPVLNQRAAVRVFERLLDDNGIGESVDTELWQFMPRSLSIGAQQELAEIMLDHIANGEVRDAAFAAGHIASIPSALDRVIPAIEARICSDIEFRRASMVTLAATADHSDIAWDAFRRCLESSDAELRARALDLVPILPNRHEQVRPIALRAIDDAWDPAAVAAIHSLGRLSTDLCPHASKLLRTGVDRPATRGVVAWALALHSCRSDELRELIRSGLASGDPEITRLALLSITRVGDICRPLRADLERLANEFDDLEVARLIPFALDAMNSP